MHIPAFVIGALLIGVLLDTPPFFILLSVLGAGVLVYGI